jgi:hypothetical protein
VRKVIKIPADDVEIMMWRALLALPEALDTLQKIQDLPPLDLDVQAFMTRVAAIRHAASEIELQAYEIERDNAAALNALSPDLWWSTRDAAECLGVSMRTMQQRAREYGAIRRGGRWWFHPERVRGGRQLRLLYRGTP